MRIGIMLRCIDERGGIGIYARHIVEELLRIDSHNAYILFFASDQHLHRYDAFPNATARLLPSGNKVWWDQVVVPIFAGREKLDILFNPKFTLPLWGAGKAVMTVHGADWFLPEYRYLYHALDRFYMRLFMPLYVRRAAAIISASDYSTQGYLRYLPGSAGKIHTIHYCQKGSFRPIHDDALLQEHRRKYQLPERFILSVIHYDTGRKNFANMLKAFALARRRGIPHHYVVCGREVERYARELPLRELGVESQVHFKGWVEQDDLPAMYNSADLYLYATRLEGFPIPIMEALACGCPIITSKGGVFPEAAGDGALYVDPEDPNDIAAAVVDVLQDPQLHLSLKTRGVNRSRLFSWAKCAAQTMALFESLMQCMT